MDEKRSGMREVGMVKVIWLDTIVMKWGGRGGEIYLA